MKKLSLEFYISVLINLIVPAGLIATLFNWLTTQEDYIVAIVISLIVAISIIISYLVFYRILGIIIKTDGLKFIKNKIDNYKTTGGKIFTTALFENYDDGDKIGKKIIELEESFEKQFSLERLVFLDDPTQEFIWIGDFIRLNEIKNFKPVIYRISAEKRTVIRKIIKQLPRFSITAFYSGDRINEIYIGIIGDKKGFGIASKNPKVCKYFSAVIREYKAKCQVIENIDQIPPYEEFAGGSINRIVDALEEHSTYREYIHYVGVFGSNGLLLQNKLSKSHKCELEGDLDLIIVVGKEVDLEAFKIEILNLIEKEKIGEHSVEWSNLENKYYEKRNPIHIDIQLHKKHDDYYQKAPLIGYSILDHSLFQIYSRGNELISEHLKTPEIPVDFQKRLSLVLNSSEYGIHTAKNRIANERYYNTDHNRVLWIALQNYIWAVTGHRTRDKRKIFNYISRTNWFNDIEELKGKFKKGFQQNMNIDFLSKESVILVLDTIINNLKQCQK